MGSTENCHVRFGSRLSWRAALLQRRRRRVGLGFDEGQKGRTSHTHGCAQGPRFSSMGCDPVYRAKHMDCRRRDGLAWLGSTRANALLQNEEIQTHARDAAWGDSPSPLPSALVLHAHASLGRRRWAGPPGDAPLPRLYAASVFLVPTTCTSALATVNSLAKMTIRDFCRCPASLAWISCFSSPANPLAMCVTTESPL